AAPRPRAPVRSRVHPDVGQITAHEPTGQLLAAWIAKEELCCLLALARTRPVRSDIASQLFRFYDWCARAGVPEVTTLAQTIEAWWPQILAFTGTGITNARNRGKPTGSSKTPPALPSASATSTTNAAEYGCTANGRR